MPQSVQSFWVTVTRPKDLLEITFEFRGVLLETQPGQKGTITGLDGSRLVVYFASQHVAEEAIFETAAGFEPSKEEKEAYKETDPNRDLDKEYADAAKNPQVPASPGGILAMFSGPSRLVFDVPRDRQIDYTLEGLLGALNELPLIVSPIMTYQPPGCNPLFWVNPSLIPPAPKIAKPDDDLTAIEAPYRLILSPDDKALWDHARAPVEHLGRTELWHTRLSAGDGDQLPELRAIWSPDYKEPEHQPHEDKPFRMSLDAHDRNELVHLTSDWYLTHSQGNYTPEPVEADQLMLSTMGAWLKVYGDWPVGKEIELTGGGLLTVEEWRHEMTMSRDQYVRVIYAGYLYPWRHRGSLVKITERKFYYNEDPPGYIAYLFQRMFILVRERTVAYSHREMPLRSVTIKTRITPNLNPPADSRVLSAAVDKTGQEAFWPMVSQPDGSSIDFQFEMSAIDWDNKQHEFTSPAIFVSLDTDKQHHAIVENAYNVLTPKNSDRRRRPFSGQAVAYAPPSEPLLGDTTLNTTWFTFAGLPVEGKYGPHFKPAMALATVDIPAVARMLGTSGAHDIVLDEAFTTKKSTNPSSTNIGNKGEVFARLPDEPGLKFQVDKGGGLVAPDITISGLSRALGPVDAREHQITPSIIDGGFAVEKIFDGVKLLGGIPLGHILKNVGTFDHAVTAGPKLPNFKSQIVDENGVKTARTTYTYIVKKEGLRSHEMFTPETDALFSIESRIDQPLNGDPGNFNLKGELTNFKVLLLPGTPLVEIQFEQLLFVAVKDKKPEVSVDLKGIEFKGILAFVNTLSEIIPLDGFSDPPHLDIKPSGIEVGYSLGIPVVAVGMFSLQNISLSSGVFLPLISDKKLNFRFAFCERHQPFLMTVTLFGGGGFFGLDVGVDGVILVEAALEFGAAAAINLGVASGSLSFMGGVYFQKSQGGFELTGYFRANGSLSVLGIITVSVEFYLGLTYTSKEPTGPHAGAMWGQAKLTVKIKIAFFSKSVSIGMEREFGGSDPRFNELVAPSDWSLYCGAFAEY